jgi:hypothetical protein
VEIWPLEEARDFGHKFGTELQARWSSARSGRTGL